MKDVLTVILFFAVTGLFLVLIPNTHTSLLLSFFWTVFFMYRFGHKKVVDYLNNGINKISNDFNSLVNQQKSLLEQIDKRQDDVKHAEQNYTEELVEAEKNSKEQIDCQMLKIEETVKSTQKKYQQIFKSIEKEYVEVIKSKLTDLIVKKLTNKIENSNSIGLVSENDIKIIMQSITDVKSISN